MGIYRFYFWLMVAVVPHQLWAIPRSIAQIVCTFEGQNKKKMSKADKEGDRAKGAVEAASTSVGGEAAALPVEAAGHEPSPALSNAQQARLAIDEAIKDSKLAQHPATWYYRGVIYDRLLRNHIVSEEAPALLNEALAAYEQVKKLSLPNTQFHSFALGNIASLWSYYLERGIGYYKQEAFDQAVDQFAICKRILPEEPTPLLYTAMVYHSSDRPEEALRGYEAYLQIQGSDVAVCRAMAAIQYHQLKNFDQAIALLDRALVQFPFNNELLEEKLLIYKAAGKIDAYATALAVVPPSRERNYAYAYFLEDQGRIEEAIACYQQILKDNPNQYDTLRQMGFLFYNEAIQAYANAPKLEEQKEQSKNSAVADLQALIYIRVNQRFTYPLEWNQLPLGVKKGVASQERPFFASPIFVVYDHPLVKRSGTSSLSNLVKSGSIPYTSRLYGYVNAKIAAALARNKWAQTMAELEKYLKKSLHYLKMARAQDKKDKTVAQALYYSYYHLKKYGSAYRLLRAMQRQKQYLEDDPFFEHKDKD